jgi:hypothetical protein
MERMMTDFLAGAIQTDEAEPKTRPRRAPRTERPRRERPTKRKPAAPPNRVEPGWVHDAAAAFLLRYVQSATTGKADVGEVSDNFLRSIPGAEDAPEPAVLLARVLAHLGHRIPGFRRVEKRLEGTDMKAGFGSDLAALFLQLWVRNRDLIKVAADAYREQAKPSTVQPTQPEVQ